MKKWQCTVCKYIHKGEEPPETCPVCGVSGDKFILLEEPAEEKAAAPEAVAAESVAAAPEPPPSPSGEAGPSAESPAPDTLYEKITHLMVKHHAHPISVHMPNGIVPVAVILFVLAWLFDASLFVKAGFINLVFVVLALPLVLFSGVLEWKKKYAQGMTLIFKVKILAATLTTTACVISLAWYLLDPQVLDSSRAWAFILINLIMLGGAGVAGHIGGKLVFKD